MRILAAFLLALSTLAGASKILVTVVDPKSGVMVPNLKAEDFSVLDDKTPARSKRRNSRIPTWTS
jgi:hypothetical protein